MEKNENMIDGLMTEFKFTSITGEGRTLSVSPNDLSDMSTNNAYALFRNHIYDISVAVARILRPDSEINFEETDPEKRGKPKSPQELYEIIKDDLNGFGLDIDYDKILEKYDITTKVLVVAHDMIHLMSTMIDNFDYSKAVDMIRSILPIDTPDNTPNNGLNKLSDIKVDPFDVPDDEDDDDEDDEVGEHLIPPMMGKTYGGSSDE